VDLHQLQERYVRTGKYNYVIDKLTEEKLLNRSAGILKLTDRGRLLSNEIFEKFIADRQEISQ